MTQPAQILLFVVIIILTTVFTASGIQVYYILKELRQTANKMNRIIEEAGLVVSSIAKPIAGASGFLMGLKSGTELIKLLRGKKEERSP